MPSSGSSRIEIVDPQAGETIAINRQLIANGHDTDNLYMDDVRIRLTLAEDAES